MYPPVPGFEPTSSVFLGERVTHLATVADLKFTKKSTQGAHASATKSAIFLMTDKEIHLKSFWFQITTNISSFVPCAIVKTFPETFLQNLSITLEFF